MLVSFNSSTTDVTSRAGSAYPSGAPSFFVVFCRSLFVPLSFFCCPLCCLSFLNIQILITLLVFSSSFHWKFINSAQEYIGLGLWCIWCLSPLATIFQLYRGVSFIGGGNRSTRWKSSIYRKSLTNFVILYIWSRPRWPRPIYTRYQNA